MYTNFFPKQRNNQTMRKTTEKIPKRNKTGKLRKIRKKTGHEHSVKVSSEKRRQRCWRKREMKEEKNTHTHTHIHERAHAHTLIHKTRIREAMAQITIA